MDRNWQGKGWDLTDFHHGYLVFRVDNGGWSFLIVPCIRIWVSSLEAVQMLARRMEASVLLVCCLVSLNFPQWRFPSFTSKVKRNAALRLFSGLLSFHHSVPSSSYCEKQRWNVTFLFLLLNSSFCPHQPFYWTSVFTLWFLQRLQNNEFHMFPTCLLTHEYCDIS